MWVFYLSDVLFFWPKYHPIAAITKLFNVSLLILKNTDIPNITTSVRTIIALTDTPPTEDSSFIIKDCNLFYIELLLPIYFLVGMIVDI